MGTPINIVHLSQYDITQGRIYHVTLDEISNISAGVNNFANSYLEQRCISAVAVTPLSSAHDSIYFVYELSGGGSKTNSWTFTTPVKFNKPTISDQPYGAEVIVNGFQLPFDRYTLSGTSLVLYQETSVSSDVYIKSFVD